MNPASPDQDPIETWLRKSGASIPDDGFSQRVLAALPAPARAPAHSARRRFALACGGATLGLAAGLIQFGFPSATSIQESLAHMQNALPRALPIPLDLTGVSIVLAVVIVSIGIAFSREIDRAL